MTYQHQISFATDGHGEMHDLTERITADSAISVAHVEGQLGYAMRGPKELRDS